MLDRDKGDFVFHCDGFECREFLETGTSNFASAQNLLHRHRWMARKAGEDWKHFCSACRTRAQVKRGWH